MRQMFCGSDSSNEVLVPRVCWAPDPVPSAAYAFCPEGSVPLLPLILDGGTEAQVGETSALDQALARSRHPGPGTLWPPWNPEPRCRGGSCGPVSGAHVHGSSCLFTTCSRGWDKVHTRPEPVSSLLADVLWARRSFLFPVGPAWVSIL